MPPPKSQPTLFQAALPVLFLLTLISWGLIIRPQWQGLPPIPLEVIFILAATFTVAELRWLGHRWPDIQNTILTKFSSALPAFFILFSIGLIIGSWMICGTIPMLVYYGLKIIHPSLIYLLAFWIPIVFSTLTGTSWGSAGSIGIVLIGIGSAIGADLGITAGAIIGGAYFGDKMSPLSDTTNLAALAADVDLYDHIHSMLYTTLPSAIIASVVYAALGFLNPPVMNAQQAEMLTPFLDALQRIFNFNVFLLLPPAIVLFSALRRYPTVPTLLISTLVACLLSFLFQPFSIADVAQTLYRGFDISMAPWTVDVPEKVITLVNRGGLYALEDAIVVAMMVFMFIGAMDHINAMPTVVSHVFRFAKSRTAVILSTLAAAGVTNALTSNQYATSFIVGDAFKSKFDTLKIKRKVLSRSLEDTGTMIESIVPWTPTAVFMVATLGVPFSDYFQWQLLSWINFIIAPTIAILGVGCFYEKNQQNETSRHRN